MKVGNGLFYVLGGISGTYLILQIVDKCPILVESRFLRFFERNSILILGTHQLYLTWIVRKTRLMRNVVGLPIVFALILLLEVVTILVVKRTAYFRNKIFQITK